MKEAITSMFKQVNGQGTILERYPNYDPADGKVHVLFVSCTLNGNGLYRMLLPSMQLNKTKSHVGIVATLHKWDYTKSFEDYDNPVDDRLIKWADIVVLPTILSDASYIVEALRKLNPELAFVMDIDMLYHDIPDSHPMASRVGEEQLNHLIRNIARMDLITGPKAPLLKYYHAKLRSAFKFPKVRFSVLPNLIPVEAVEKLSTTREDRKDKMRIGIVGSPTIAGDVMTIIEPIVQAIQEKPDELELVLFGWNGKLKGQQLFEGIDVTVERPVKVTEYYEKLCGLGLDLALIPAQENAFNEIGKSNIKYGEMAALGVPVLASALAPCKDILKDKESGFIAADPGQWKAGILGLLESPEQYKEIGQHARKVVLKHLGWNRLKTEVLAELWS